MFLTHFTYGTEDVLAVGINNTTPGATVYFERACYLHVMNKYTFECQLFCVVRLLHSYCAVLCYTVLCSIREPNA